MWSHIYRVFFFLWIQSGGCKSAILRSFEQFLYFLHSKVLLINMNKKKVNKFHLLKKENFQGWLKFTHFQPHFSGGGNFNFNFLKSFLDQF